MLTYSGLKYSPDFDSANACLISLLATAIKASFLDFPFFVIRSNNILQAGLYLYAVNELKNNRFLICLFPVFVILLCPLILLLDVLIDGDWNCNKKMDS